MIRITRAGFQALHSHPYQITNTDDSKKIFLGKIKDFLEKDLVARSYLIGGKKLGLGEGQRQIVKNPKNASANVQ